MHRVSQLAQHVRPEPVVYTRIAEGDYERSKHKLKSGDTVVVTGAAGFVGGWLVTYCLERGYSVRACVRDVDDDSKTGFMKAMPEYGSKLTLHAADMTVEHACKSLTARALLLCVDCDQSASCVRCCIAATTPDDEIFEGAHTVFHPAEVFMSAGRPTGWARDSGQQISEKMLHENAMQTCQFMVDSINKSSTVRRLIYTSSIAAMMPTVPGAYIDNPIIDENREPHASHASPYGYNMTKRSTEHFFACKCLSLSVSVCLSACLLTQCVCIFR
jgi:nucleoside-diphosphate-sugar epimerase